MVKCMLVPDEMMVGWVNGEQESSVLAVIVMPDHHMVPPLQQIRCSFTFTTYVSLNAGTA